MGADLTTNVHSHGVKPVISLFYFAPLAKGKALTNNSLEAFPIIGGYKKEAEVGCQISLLNFLFDITKQLG